MHCQGYSFLLDYYSFNFRSMEKFYLNVCYFDKITKIDNFSFLFLAAYERIMLKYIFTDSTTTQQALVELVLLFWWLAFCFLERKLLHIIKVSLCRIFAKRHPFYLIPNHHPLITQSGEEIKLKPYSGMLNIDFGKGIGKRDVYLL